VDNIVALLSSRILNGDIQLKSLNALKSVSERSNHFRRTLALSYLLSEASAGDYANLNQAYGSSEPCTPQSNYSEDMQSSNGSTPALSEVQVSSLIKDMVSKNRSACSFTPLEWPIPYLYRIPN
jgi:hypothetical protein